MSAIIDHAVQGLLRDGFTVVPRAIEPDHIGRLEADVDPYFVATPWCQGAFYGERTRRFGSLLRRSHHMTALVMHASIRAIVDHILLPGCDRIQLNLTQAIEIHPGATAQFPHRDQDMWPGPKERTEYLVNVMWPLSPFRVENGGTRLWPGSHRCEESSLPEADAVVPAVLQGDALLFLGSTLHGGGAHRAIAPRRGIVVSYCLGWLKPFELQWLVYPPEIARSFSPELAALVGYAQHRPNLGNVEGQCPSILLRDDVPAHIGAVDALLPDQAAMATGFLTSNAG